MITNDQFETLFNDLFLASEHTKLINGVRIGASEPLYTPAQGQDPAQIIYAHGFITSAFHEVAHWCYAGVDRRQRIDYGYWYAGEYRDQSAQDDFERVELVPQAYEYLLCQAAQHPFQVSLDNFNHEVMLDRDGFEARVKSMAANKQKTGLSPRLNLLLNALQPIN